MGIGLPAFSRMPLERYGLRWPHAELPLAHPFPDGTAAVLARSVCETADSPGPGRAYRRLVAGRDVCGIKRRRRARHSGA
ncbi:hypothetical protein [Streptomyces sp. 8K308]|uniref:hypothetical protein n=1 Tax=Streptomyces sp. 8K308 TaxID=2530388 RepID=UPI0026C1181E